MELLMNEPFDISEYCGRLVVTYLEEDEQDLAELFARLEAEGYDYTKNPLSPHAVIKTSYVSKVEQMLKICGCYILCLTKNFTPQLQPAMWNHVWYQVGLLHSWDKEIVIPLNLGGDIKILPGTPLQGQNICDSVEAVIRGVTTDKRYRRLVKTHIFEDDEVGKFATKRLDYRKLVIKFDITEQSFADAKEEYCDLAGEGDIDDEEFEKILRDNVSLNCLLLSFGAERGTTAQLAPYRSEMSITPTIYPKRFSCKKLYISKPGYGEVVGEYLFELVLPIHRLFGVNFKPCLVAGPDIDAEVLSALFAPNFISEKTDPVKKGNSLYFSLAFPKAAPFSIDPELKIGQIGDYLFPQ